MLLSSKIGATENVSRCPATSSSSTSSTATSTRKTIVSPGRSCRVKDSCGRTYKRTPLGFYSTALAALGDVGQPNNDDVADKEVDADWRSVRAKLVMMEQTGEEERNSLGSSWAHEIAQPEKGCSLVCRRSGMGFFHRSVVFVLGHDDSKATTGLVLNLPSTSLLQDAIARGWEPGEFNGERIYYGGPVEMNSLHIIHNHKELKKCSEVIDGIYVGGFEDAHAQVKANNIAADEFKLLVGYSNWGPGQLRQELQDKCWYVISASTDVILQKAAVDSPEEFNELLWTQVLKLSGLEHPF